MCLRHVSYVNGHEADLCDRVHCEWSSGRLCFRWEALQCSGRIKHTDRHLCSFLLPSCIMFFHQRTKNDTASKMCHQTVTAPSLAHFLCISHNAPWWNTRLQRRLMSINSNRCQSNCCHWWLWQWENTELTCFIMLCHYLQRRCQQPSTNGPLAFAAAPFESKSIILSLQLERKQWSNRGYGALRIADDLFRSWERNWI